MSTTAASTHAPAASFLARGPVWQVSYLSALAASVVVEAWGLATRAVGVPMRVAGLGAHHACPSTSACSRWGRWSSRSGSRSPSS